MSGSVIAWRSYPSGAGSIAACAGPVGAGGSRYVRRMARRWWIGVPFALGAVIALGWFARPKVETPTSPSPSPPNVLIVLWDTVRADRMSLYGHDRPTTPRLEAFARSAAVYERAISPAMWTVPSHGSLFTGLSAGLPRRCGRLAVARRAPPDRWPRRSGGRGMRPSPGRRTPTCPSTPTCSRASTPATSPGEVRSQRRPQRRPATS